MKRLLTVTILLFASLLYSQSKFDINNLIDRGGLKYAPNDDEPYTGKVFDFYENGQKKLDGNYRNGLMNGKWTYYHENGQIYVQGRFIDGDGSNLSELSGVPFNGRTGRWNVWFKNGQKESEGTYRNGNLIGKFEIWLDDGTKVWEHYNNDDGTRDSTKLTIQWYENGQKQFEGYWKNTDDTAGVWIGKHTVWHENGQKMVEGTFKNGKQDAIWTWWYENGQKWKEGTFKNGELDGKWTEWYENGQKKVEQTYKDGELDGKWTFFNEDGSIKDDMDEDEEDDWGEEDDEWDDW